ncbi:hypothetical protein HHI36_020327 [Cryptolaemus montrouzieri]|uniref:Structure-specific endonuclease subunit SLX4 n=1 Tax=Cryptolaemus montrouzieri TaxID=559131 RepID=A0ABD2N9X3_9CUCU
MNSNTGDSISLNLTEHIEKMLMNSYGQTNSLINECENHLGKEKTETENRRSKSTYQLSSLLKKLMKNEELIVDKNKVDSDNLSGCSKSSEDVVCISDEELNYSCAQDNQHIDHFENLAEEELKNSNYFCSTPLRKYSKSSEDIVCISDEDCKNNENIDSHKNPADAEKSKNPKHSCSTPLRKYASFSETPTRVKTPKFGRNKSESNITPNRKVIIKTENITPMANYDKMDTPVIVNELSKFGLKPLKRKRGVNLLKHIYEMTHPVVKSKKAVDGCHSIAKKLKMDEFIKDVPKMDGSRSVEPWLETILETDIIFERQRSSKIPTCQIPLQIVWHNFLVENPKSEKIYSYMNLFKWK